jgi:hypothetical protein
MGKTTRIGKSLIAIQKELGTDEQCVAFLEAVRWPDGVRCLKCDSDRISKFFTAEGTRNYKNPKTGKTEIRTVPARHLYQCLNPECKFQFTATAGTIFDNTHLPLRKWMLAVAIMCNAKKGMSAKELQRDIEVSYKTAWYLSHRIREAMDQGNLFGEKLTGVVEVDETYIGGAFDKRRKRERREKPGVMGIRERGGEVRAFHVERITGVLATKAVTDNISIDAELVCTDQSPLYHTLKARGYNHDIVHHTSKEYVRGDVHTNSIENFWSLFKRGLIGSFHKISAKHLDRYLAEFMYRFNNRTNQELFVMTLLYMVIASPLPYDKLCGPKDQRIVGRKKPQTPTATSPDEPF